MTISMQHQQNRVLTHYLQVYLLYRLSPVNAAFLTDRNMNSRCSLNRLSLPLMILASYLSERLSCFSMAGAPSPSRVFHTHGCLVICVWLCLCKQHHTLRVNIFTFKCHFFILKVFTDLLFFILCSPIPPFFFLALHLFDSER